MASREKKITSGRKQASASPVPKEEPPSEPLTKSAQPSEDPKEAEEDGGPAPQEKQPIKKPVIRKKDPKKVVKRSFKIKLKPKTKVTPKLAKNLLSKKGVKKALLKNGRSKVIRKKPQQKQNDPEDSPPELKPPNIPSEDKKKKPPVLKPIYPLETGKKKPQKKTDPTYCTITATIESIIKESVQSKPKKPAANKIMKKQSTIDSIAESIEGVVEFGYLLEEEMKSEQEQKSEAASETKLKKANHKKKVDLLKKKLKKDNIENDLDPSDRNLIDMLDLNVDNIKSKAVVNRRHSIEKFQITNPEPKSDTPFVSVPRSLSPKLRKPIKTRQSLDSKRSSPYTTRSDSPARILRNGKQRKLKQKLLDGLDSEYKKRRRLCSDYSGSEISVSKLSGYESDSSFSDLASLHGSENPENLDPPPKTLAIKRELLETLENNPPDAEIDCSALKRLSVETGTVENRIDTNSNVCSDDVKIVDDVKIETFSEETINPSFKVPDKSIILGIMKQTFNDVVNEDQQEKEKRKTRSSAKKKGEEEPTVSTAQFYGVQTIDEVMQELEEAIGEKTEVVLETTSLEEASEEVVKEGEVIVETESVVEGVDNVEIGANLEVSAAIDLPTLEETQVLEEEKIVDVESVMPENGEIVEKEDISLTNNETPENLERKNQILQALGLQSLQAAEEAKLRKLVPKTNSYTGTLKTVIKLNRCEKKKGRNSLKMTLQKKGKSSSKDEDLVRVDEDEYKIMKDGGGGAWKTHHGGQSSDTAGAQRKSHYSNRSNMDGSSEHTSDGDTNANEEQKNLVIPEKASSFSIHPGRLCKDECSYCFGKFGLFDTPCHIAQMKSVDRQNKILGAEKHLTRDSCLCDACYRHVDRKSNTPSYTNNKSVKRNNLVAPGPRQNHCHVLGCGKIATNILRRKWLIKMRKSVCEIINIDLDNPGLHSIPICQEHYSAIDHLMDCSMCKRRLARNHIHYLGPESNDLNTALNNMGIPVKLNDRPVVCKLCRYFATLVLKNAEDWSDSSANFYTEYRKRLLHFHDIELMEEGQAEEPIPAPMKEKDQKKKKKLNKNQNNLEPPVLEPQVDLNSKDESNSRVPSADSRPESPTDFMVDYNKLVPNIAMECGADVELSSRENKKSNVSIKRVNKPESVKEDKSKKLKNKSDIAVQRLGSNPSISVRQLFPGEEELPLNASIEFNNIKERTPEGWEKCVSTIQYDPEIKLLWNELQKPYGNQSSFLRHLILLEKYFRNGDLLLSPTATHHSVNYTESVQNRLKAYDNISSNVGPVQPLSMIPFNKPVKTNPPPPPPPLTPPLAPAPPPPPPPPPKPTPPSIPPTSFLVPNPAALPNPTTSTAPSALPVRPKLPPGLISLQPGTKIPVTPLVKVPQSQKIKFPITKNWRPTLIAIDPSKKPEKKPGLVQVISGGKPYHITLEDYKKMCAIKRTFDLRQKRLQETQRTVYPPSSLLKNIPSRKNLMITKTLCSPTKTDSNSEPETENNLEKLDRTVEKLEAKLQDKSLMIMPKIPKSLTVIPQTVTTKKSSRPSSPTQKVIKPTGKS